MTVIKWYSQWKCLERFQCIANFLACQVSANKQKHTTYIHSLTQCEDLFRLSFSSSVMVRKRSAHKRRRLIFTHSTCTHSHYTNNRYFNKNKNKNKSKIQQNITKKNRKKCKIISLQCTKFKRIHNQPSCSPHETMLTHVQYYMHIFTHTQTTLLRSLLFIYISMSRHKSRVQ